MLSPNYPCSRLLHHELNFLLYWVLDLFLELLNQVSLSDVIDKARAGFGLGDSAGLQYPHAGHRFTAWVPSSAVMGAEIGVCLCGGCLDENQARTLCGVDDVPELGVS